MVNFVEAALAPLKNDGQIKLYGASGLPACAAPARLSPNAST